MLYFWRRIFFLGFGAGLSVRIDQPLWVATVFILALPKFEPTLNRQILSWGKFKKQIKNLKNSASCICRRIERECRTWRKIRQEPLINIQLLANTGGRKMVIFRNMLTRPASLTVWIWRTSICMQTTLRFLQFCRTALPRFGYQSVARRIPMSWCGVWESIHFWPA